LMRSHNRNMVPALRISVTTVRPRKPKAVVADTAYRSDAPATMSLNTPKV
jgi:hypothetical protein